MVTTAQLTDALKTMAAVCEAIREAGTIPSGHLYATLMGRMDANAYEAMLRQILRTGLVARTGDVLRWVG